MKALITVRYEMSTDPLVYLACNFYFFVEGMWIQGQEEIFFFAYPPIPAFIPLTSLSIWYISTFPHVFLLLNMAFSFQALRIKMLMKHIISVLDMKWHPLDSDYQAGH